MSQNSAISTAALIITAFVFIIVCIGWWLTGSDGILSDTLHLIGDCFPFIIILMIERARSKERRQDLRLRLWKLNSLYLWCVGTIMLFVGFWRIDHPHPVERSMLWFALLNLFGNSVQFCLSMLLKKDDRDHEHAHDHAHDHAHSHGHDHGAEGIRSVILHFLADTVASFAVLCAGFAIYRWQANWTDSIATIIVGCFTLLAAYRCSIGKRHNH